jgi:NADPH:quinone reductase
MKALCFDRFGSSDVLYYGDVPDPICGEFDVIMRTKAIGLNYADIYRRRGNYHLLGAPPYIAGYEATGVVERVGTGITDIQVGDRMAVADVPFANAESMRVPVEHVIPLPDDISFEIGAALLLQGLTAWYLCHDSYAVSSGETAIVHAAAGGVGLLLVQMLRAQGVRVIGLTSSDAKKPAIIAAGAEEVCLYSDAWIERTKEWTQSKGADVVFDSVGSTLQQSFRAVRDCGTVVFYGMSGGNPDPVDPRMLMDTSKTLTGGDLWSYIVLREERVRRSDELFALVRAGQLQVQIAARIPLAQGAKAHDFLESRTSIGKVLLIP